MPEKPTTTKPTSQDNYLVRVERAHRLANTTSAVLLAGLLASMTCNVYLWTRPPAPPHLINFKPEAAQVIEIRPGHMQLADLQLVAENYFRAYVVDRETIDHATETARYDRVRLFTCADNFNAFKAAMTVENKASPLNVYRKENMTRETVVTTAPAPVPGTNDAYSVEFRTIDRRHGQEVARRDWVATWNFYQVPLKVSRAEIYINPLGLQICNYSIRARNS